MKYQDVIEILKDVTKERNIDFMTIGELKAMVIGLTGLVAGLLLNSGKSVDEIKEIIKD